MSISLGTWQNPLPSSNPYEPRWKRPAARVAVVVLPFLLLAALLTSPLVEIFASAAGQIQERSAQRAALEPFREKAKLWRVDYETAREGDYVEWCVDRPSTGYAYLEGRPSQPILLSNENLLDVGYPRGHCAMIVGQVEGRKPNGLAVRVIGQP